MQINWQSKKSCCSILKFFKVSPGHTVKDMELFDATVSPHFSSDQARLWACGRGDVSTPSFGSHLNPISTRGADYAHSTLVSTQSFESHRCACSVSAPATVPLFNICLWLQLYLRWYAPLKAKHALNANLIIMIHENITNICPAIIDGTW